MQLTECRLKLSHRSFPSITHACFYIIIKLSPDAQRQCSIFPPLIFA